MAVQKSASIIEFVEMISEDEKGLRLDLTRLHQVQAIAAEGRVTLGPLLR